MVSAQRDPSGHPGEVKVISCRATPSITRRSYTRPRSTMLTPSSGSMTSAKRWRYRQPGGGSQTAVLVVRSLVRSGTVDTSCCYGSAAARTRACRRFLGSRMGDTQGGLDERLQPRRLDRRIDLVEHALHEPQVNRADDFAVVFGGLAERTVAQVDLLITAG